jgi:hypothetical protein
MVAAAVPAWLRTQRALVVPVPVEVPGVVATFRPRAVERPGS